MNALKAVRDSKTAHDAAHHSNALVGACACNRWIAVLRAIALDLDGTLCNSAGVVTDATAAALAVKAP